MLIQFVVLLSHFECGRVFSLRYGFFLFHDFQFVSQFFGLKLYLLSNLYTLRQLSELELSCKVTHQTEHIPSRMFLLKLSSTHHSRIAYLFKWFEEFRRQLSIYTWNTTEPIGYMLIAKWRKWFWFHYLLTSTYVSIELCTLCLFLACKAYGYFPMNIHQLTTFNSTIKKIIPTNAINSTIYKNRSKTKWKCIRKFSPFWKQFTQNVWRQVNTNIEAASENDFIQRKHRTQPNFSKKPLFLMVPISNWIANRTKWFSVFFSSNFNNKKAQTILVQFQKS